mmetsp:Transcript_6834/g.9434  ORF Transcript_6834/g.9434 Transcript_6834/m.9434 type:complete len:222 (-) Transcript_6834:87-752(-)
MIVENEEKESRLVDVADSTDPDPLRVRLRERNDLLRAKERERMRKYRSELATRLSDQQLEERLLKERERKKLSRLRNTSEETKARERERKRKARSSVNADETRAKERERKRLARSIKNNLKRNQLIDHTIQYGHHLESDGTEHSSVGNIYYSLSSHHNQIQESCINLGVPYDLAVEHGSCLPHIISYDHYLASNNESSSSSNSSSSLNITANINNHGDVGE